MLIGGSQNYLLTQTLPIIQRKRPTTAVSARLKTFYRGQKVRDQELNASNNLSAFSGLQVSSQHPPAPGRLRPAESRRE